MSRNRVPVIRTYTFGPIDRIRVGDVFYCAGHWRRVEEINVSDSYGETLIFRHGYREFMNTRKMSLTLRSFQEAIWVFGWTKVGNVRASRKLDTENSVEC
jgi:hypothetical protein